jgi:hypothetical protein
MGTTDGNSRDLTREIHHHWGISTLTRPVTKLPIAIRPPAVDAAGIRQAACVITSGDHLTERHGAVDPHGRGSGLCGGVTELALCICTPTEHLEAVGKTARM